MARKDSTVKKVGRFVTNELLGVDDAKRAVSKAKKGDVKGALKSAGAAALELGTTATAVGKGGALAAKLGAKTVSKKTVERTSEKVGDAVGRKVAESMKPSKYPSAQGKKFSIKTEGKATTTSKSGSKSVTADSKKVEGTKKAPTEKQRLGSYNAQETKRVSNIEGASVAGKSGSKPIVKKALGDVSIKRLAQGAVLQKGASKLTEKNKKKTGK